MKNDCYQEHVFYSPAKINLFLRVLRKREDGFHDIATLMQVIDIYDRISFKKASYDVFSCNIPSLITDPSNTVKRTLALYREKTGCNTSFHIHLEKNIPIQGGLGGGSSNVATTLWALNSLNNDHIDLSTLIQWAGEIGSDAALFFAEGSAYCQGRGEIIENMFLPFIFEGYLAIPSFGVSTSAVYQAFHFLEKKETPPEEMIKSFLQGIPIYHNDLERAALFVEPRLRKVKEQLLSIGFDSVMMTGSGSNFICLGEKEPPLIPNLHFRRIKASKRNKTSWYNPDEKTQEI